MAFWGKGGVLAGVFCVFLVLMGGGCTDTPPQTAGETEIIYFYDQVCGSCDDEGAFVEYFNEKLSDVKAEAEFTLSFCNVFQKEEAYRTFCEEMEISAEEQQLPMLAVGERYVSGEQAVKAQLRMLFCEEFGIADEKTVQYYYRPECADCLRIADFMDKLEADNPGLSFVRIDTTPSRPKADFKERLSRWQVPEEEWQVPFFYYNGRYLSGDAAIEEQARELLETK